ncbi:uncharacterized protein LOC104871840 isoform X2 [Fukomys damarensis]|uniref:uncharacterized protein LOC104871840 isoform X2 n=1 Tax=Fukomys damarensis TaxID=885580 RepID=UPI0014556EBB|nr:uncharacterized protein LOC104871840 isoform X2 [Fukomys damarensis]
MWIEALSSRPLSLGIMGILGRHPGWLRRDRQTMGNSCVAHTVSSAREGEGQAAMAGQGSPSPLTRQSRSAWLGRVVTQQGPTRHTEPCPPRPWKGWCPRIPGGLHCDGLELHFTVLPIAFLGPENATQGRKRSWPGPWEAGGICPEEAACAMQYPSSCRVHVHEWESIEPVFT